MKRRAERVGVGTCFEKFHLVHGVREGLIVTVTAVLYRRLHEALCKGGRCLCFSGELFGRKGELGCRSVRDVMRRRER